MSTYYNEHDPYAAQWLRNLMAAGAIPDGVVDERSIVDVAATDIRGFRQCHFFAGIGGWAYALRLAGWPDDAPIWTGSCPCQPFSAAGKRKGTADDRHLWPALYDLIRERKPAMVVGEQVASRDALGWLDAVQIDLEAAGYAVGAIDLSAAGIGAPHIRQRLYWVAKSVEQRCSRAELCAGQEEGNTFAVARSGFGGLANSDERKRGWLPTREGCDRNGQATEREQGNGKPESGVTNGGMAEPYGDRREPGRIAPASDRHGDTTVTNGGDYRACPTDGYWRDADWLFCRDGKWRPVEPGTFPLVDGVPVDLGWDGPGENPYRQAPPSRAGMLRGYGNAIVPELAAKFLRAVLDLRRAGHSMGCQSAEKVKEES